MSAESISGAELESTVVAGKKRAAVLFWANWDGASKVYMPSFEQVANEKGYAVAFFKFDVDSDQATTSKYNIRSVPTVTLFKSGAVSGQLVGAVTKSRLSSFIDSL